MLTSPRLVLTLGPAMSLWGTLSCSPLPATRVCIFPFGTLPIDSALSGSCQLEFSLLGSPHVFCLDRQDDTSNRTVRKKWSDLSLFLSLKLCELGQLTESQKLSFPSFIKKMMPAHLFFFFFFNIFIGV